MVAPIIGLTLGGWITDNWNWRWNFYINLPVGFVAFTIVSAFVHDPSYMRQTRAQKGRIDYLGILLLTLVPCRSSSIAGSAPLGSTHHGWFMQLRCRQLHSWVWLCMSFISARPFSTCAYLSSASLMPRLRSPSPSAQCFSARCFIRLLPG